MSESIGRTLIHSLVMSVRPFVMAGLVPAIHAFP